MCLLIVIDWNGLAFGISLFLFFPQKRWISILFSKFILHIKEIRMPYFARLNEKEFFKQVEPSAFESLG